MYLGREFPPVLSVFGGSLGGSGEVVIGSKSRSLCKRNALYSCLCMNVVQVLQYVNEDYFIVCVFATIGNCKALPPQ